MAVNDDGLLCESGSDGHASLGQDRCCADVSELRSGSEIRAQTGQFFHRVHEALDVGVCHKNIWYEERSDLKVMEDREVTEDGLITEEEGTVGTGFQASREVGKARFKIFLEFGHLGCETFSSEEVGDRIGDDEELSCIVT